MGDKPFLGLVVPFVPVLGWIRAYKAKDFPTDLVAGLSLAAFVIPESLAYASLAQLPPVTGLYCYLVAGIAYAVFGTSRQLAVGPTSALAITIATSVVAMGDGDLSRAVTLASALALIVGVLCIAGRFVGLANVAYFISDAILVGFKTGAALYIASTQLPKLFGIEGVIGHALERFGHVVLSLHETHVFLLVVGLAAIAWIANVPHAGHHPAPQVKGVRHVTVNDPTAQLGFRTRAWRRDLHVGCGIAQLRDADRDGQGVERGRFGSSRKGAQGSHQVVAGTSRSHARKDCRGKAAGARPTQDHCSKGQQRSFGHAFPERVVLG